MATERQRRVVLGVLLAVLAVVLYRAWSGDTLIPGAPSGARSATANTRAAAGTGAGAEAAATAPDVHLKALDDQRPMPDSGERDLFRFGRRPAPPSAATQAPPPVAVNPAPLTPIGPPPLAPIPLKFIGIVESPTQSKRLAALVD